MLVLVISSFAFGVIGVVVVVVWLLSLSIVYSYLLVKGTLFFKQIQVCNAGYEFVHGWRVCVLVVGLVILGFVWFSLEVHAFHGFDCRCFSCISVLFHCFSQRRVGGSYALRVSPAVTRLTVYRRPQVTRNS